MSEIEVNIGIQFRRCPGVASPHALIAILGTCRSTRPMFGSTAGSQCSRGYNVRRGRHPPRSNRLSPTAPMAAPASTCLVRRYICRNRDAHAGGR